MDTPSLTELFCQKFKIFNLTNQPKKTCVFLDGVFKTLSTLISRKIEKIFYEKITIEGVLQLDYKLNYNSIFGVTVICNCKCVKSCMIYNLSIIRIDIYNFTKFKIQLLKNENSWNNHKSNDNSNQNG